MKSSTQAARLVFTKDPPIYRQIMEDLRKRIEAAEFEASKKLPSNRELAEEYGVNHLTVRHALRMLDEEGLIDVAHGRGVFVRSTQNLNPRVAFIVPALGEPSMGIISQTISRLLPQGFSLNIFDFHNSKDEELAILEEISKNKKFDAIILFPTMQHSSLRPLFQLMTENFPIVLLDRVFSFMPVAHVASDNRRGGFLAARHLISQGCKHIACVTTDVSTAHLRFSGFVDAFAQSSAQFNPDLVIKVPNENVEALDPALPEHLKAHPEIDGIFFWNDYAALVGLNLLKKMGKTVPEDIRVVGFDNHPLSAYAVPPLTTVRQNYEKIAEETVRLLLEVLDVPRDERFQMRQSIVPVELVVRNS